MAQMAATVSSGAAAARARRSRRSAALLSRSRGAASALRHAALAAATAGLAAGSLCANWEIHRGVNIVAGKVKASCNLMGSIPPCGAGLTYPDPSYMDYLWLGEVDSLGECQHEALKQQADPAEGTGKCVSVAYYTSSSKDEMFRKQCYCGTTKDWHAGPDTDVISARFDTAEDCWCASCRAQPDLPQPPPSAR